MPDLDTMANKRIPAPQTQRKRLIEVAAAAEANFQRSIDLVLIHNDGPAVKGVQPKASLNPLIVVTAVAAWERLVNDTYHALTTADNWFKVGEEQSEFWRAYSEKMGHLDNIEGLKDLEDHGRIVDNWKGTFAHDQWGGISPSRWGRLKGNTLGAKYGLTIGQHLDQWILLRHAIAHNAMPQLEKRISAKKWDTSVNPKSDPFRNSEGEKICLWGPSTVQAAPARACLLALLQVADSTLKTLADRTGAVRDEVALPNGWFQPELPKSLARGHQGSRVLWGTKLPVKGVRFD